MLKHLCILAALCFPALGQFTPPNTGGGGPSAVSCSSITGTPSITNYILSATGTGNACAWGPPTGGGGMVFPGAGIGNSTGSAWGTSFIAGTTANNLLQLDSSGNIGIAGKVSSGAGGSATGGIDMAFGTSANLGGNPAAGKLTLFLNSANSNHLSSLDASSNVVDLQATSGGGGTIGLGLTAPVAGNFAWVNQGSAVLDTSLNQIGISAPSAAGESWRIQEAALPGATPWTLTTAIEIGSLASENFQSVAIGVKDAGNAKILAFKGLLSSSGALSMTVTTYSNATTGVANLKTASLQNTPTYLLWLRIVNDGTNFTFYYSPSGIQWVQFFVSAVNTYLTAPSTAFFAVDASPNFGNAASLVSWRFQ